VTVANHDLIRLLDKPGLSLQENIFFLNKGEKRAFKKRTFVEARECLNL
jgi:hypothetical protein